MSIKVMSHVWDQAKEYKGSQLLLLLALADYANDSYICWPDTKTLASKTRMSERQIQRMLDQLEKRGAIVCVAGNGRGHHAHYGVLVGLTPEQQAIVTERLHNFIKGVKMSPIKKDDKIAPFSDEKGDIPETKGDIPETKGDIPETKGDIYGKQRVTFTHKEKVPNSAPESGKTAILDGGIRHVDPSVDPVVVNTDLIDRDELTAAAAKICGLPKHMDAKRQGELQQLLAMLTGEQATPEKTLLFSGYWHSKNNPLFERKGDAIGNPYPLQVISHWAQFQAWLAVREKKQQQTSRQPTQPTEETMTPEERAQMARDIRANLNARKNGARAP